MKKIVLMALAVSLWTAGYAKVNVAESENTAPAGVEAVEHADGRHFHPGEQDGCFAVLADDESWQDGHCEYGRRVDDV